MKKRAVALFLVLLFSLSVSTYAIDWRAQKVTPSLSFNGTTANCSVSVSSFGDEIDIVLELWRDNTCVGRWTGSGTSYVTVGGSCEVVKGRTYRLEASGTINGVTLTANTVTGTC